ncbi:MULTISPECIES: hypothetical protein [Idiomarinaceae]|uniref:DUF4145 domain-containing protein n=1 Tax=Pseudidiomarina fusca TaxID=2965078 RepID=A0ABU3KV74_9GAMM|nr:MULTISPECIES: hypothetical protein [Idiomarinaceae]MDT7525393.1 hypothetical protein [Pseudidiomarina sp. GXY010]MRJ41300.1 hypothetical protein [Idiomarina sp. FeN1]NCU56465.1 hypothetical protein [Idiomarina sp. FenA--70]NCU59484.1 hypothetical protein [Idiomarina sp. FenBw--71]UUN12653.1 hypothetical protein KGF88_08290 [Idiomarina loihiensis]
MKIFKVGDSHKAACTTCQSFGDTTFQLRDVPFSDGSGIVKNVLVGVCDKCDSVVLLPHQSTPAVKRQYETKRKPVEGRLPAHLIDILNLATIEIGASIDFVPNLMKYYIHALSENEMAAKSITQYLNSELAKGRADKRLSLKGRLLASEIERLKVITDIANTTDLLKSIVLKINEDLLLKRKAAPIKELRNISAALA